MNTELELVADRVQQASSYIDVFGKIEGDSSDILGSVKKTYRRLARVLHPDEYPVGTKEHQRAEVAFKLLTKFHVDAKQAVHNGTYNTTAALVTIRTKRAAYTVLRALGQGDICALYRTQTDGTGVAGFLKVAKTTADADLLRAEAKALRKLRGPDADTQYQPFVTELLDSFVHAEAGKPRRQANVIALLEGFYNLEQLQVAFGGRLDPLHVAWIWRRLLVALGFAHDNGVIHGAVLPRHVLVLPEQHGVVLTDWCYSTIREDATQTYPHIKGIVPDHRAWYPEEVLQKQAPSPATDIVMAARAMIYLLGGNPETGVIPTTLAPQQLRAFFRGCLAKSQSARPTDAWRLLKEFDELLETMGPPYYPRRFRPLTMPTGTV